MRNYQPPSCLGWQNSVLEIKEISRVKHWNQEQDIFSNMKATLAAPLSEEYLDFKTEQDHLLNPLGDSRLRCN